VDYGHPIRFGTFVTPSAGDPRRTVDLAVLSEELGFDLVTFQDHPYQPRFLDTWTLLSYVAAATRTVQLAPNVLNLPLRPAPVLARATASLDLLSGGRLALGLGAGAFWDAIAAMGGRRLAPGQAVEALAEAIDVIRALWDTDARGVVRGGPWTAVDGAKRGLAPAHRVPIWIGALGPRMLALTGRVADGWLPSLSRLGPGDLAAGNARINEAATAAGRDPRDVVRLLNVVGDEQAEVLAGLALTDGVSVFVVGGDDPDALARFAGEVAPAVRSAVADERGSRSG
jgi:alkanesulfonate monooxygenase SsuD/methylene tetrahydromethanopterin reductase-like flavin-dependent oxidoreductase (luciferase family)